MKLKILIGVLVFLILVNLATIGSFFYFQMHRPDHPPGGVFDGRPPHDMMRLGAEKRAQLRELLENFHQITRADQQQLHQSTDELFELLQSDSASTEEIDNALQSIETLRSKINHKMIETLLQAKTFLSPKEQKRFFNSMMRARPGPPERRSSKFNREGRRPQMFNRGFERPPKSDNQNKP